MAVPAFGRTEADRGQAAQAVFVGPRCRPHVERVDRVIESMRAPYAEGRAAVRWQPSRDGRADHRQVTVDLAPASGMR
ncbi:hypothetical protein UA75_09120 [Actinoalloteichus sp. GBA129-24]|uniref:Uncharacterized protein n=1 Tax=Actinoalloteichus fjordicus TaxID=1612552 RepID=A0AAC9PR44_9PSEU|nr:hypothetical protein UA74_09150 [Actinoalloteichus fjordicus]APU19840.1 hypothetical protein UA75_09120 [Actinoalloteichus sp. GBA129-24]